jgi:aspartate/methionine/tyrosine aminotransferase
MADARTRNRYFDDLFSTPDLAWMGQNTNHVPAHPVVVEAMIRSVEAGEFNAYAPPMGFEALRSAIVADLDVTAGEALVTEGGVNALAMICKARARPGTTLVTTDPTWKWPCLFAEQAGAKVIQIPIYNPATNYKLTPDALRAAVDERCSLIYIVDPNNPLGIRYERDEIEAFAEIARSVGALMIHDCTYRDFADDHTPVLRVAPRGTVVSLSFSKWLGLAGMRIGALVAEPELVDEFSAASTSVLGASVVAQRAAMAGWSVKREWMQEVCRLDRANKSMIVEAAGAAGLTVPIPVSHGNFLVLETASTGVSPEAIAEAARREGVMIRQGRYHTAAFGDRFIKVSTSVPAQWAERFCEGLPRYIETARTLNDVPALF